MGIFGNFFQGGEKKEEQSFGEENWNQLTSISQLEDLLANAGEQTYVFFKHSTRCGISRMVWNQVRFLGNEKPEDVSLYYLDLITYRDVSNAIATRLGVFHQSPQLIVLQNNEVVYEASHSGIENEMVKELF